MKSYQVEMIQTETFIVDVEAEDEQEATDKAGVLFGEGDYKEMGDCDVNVGAVYIDENERCASGHKQDDDGRCECTNEDGK